jgi:TetR/AcrR family transcriptional repressor of lmrAB and yxaGH operons
MATDTRDRLVRTTGRLLRRQGYAATGLNQIVAESDAPKGSMYFHFPGGKEELAAAAVERYARAVSASLDEGLAECPTVAEAVRRYFDGYISHVEEVEYRDGCPVATVALDEAASHPLLADAASRALTGWVDALEQALVDEGRPRDDARGLATIIVATIEGCIVMAKATRTPEALTAARDTLVPLLSRTTTTRTSCASATDP